MKNVLARWLGSRGEQPTAATQPSPVQALPLVLREGTTFPIVDWDAMQAHAPDSADAAAADRFWSGAAKSWLQALREALGGRFAVRESERFLLLGALDDSPARAVLDYLEKTRRRILRVLDGIARETGSGKLCTLVFEDQEQYYRYVSNYHPDEGEYSLSAGMFLQYGYGHFVFVQDHMSAIEPTIAHELTHCLVQHLPLPAWLNEGIAVNTESRLCPPLGRALHTPEEMHRKHLAYWNEHSIQEFWSGKSWRRAGEGNALSYDLARHLVDLCARDFAAFTAFANAADLADGGDAAARARLGYPLAQLAAAVLGEGPWQPDPARWQQGMERGQFRLSGARSR